MNIVLLGCPGSGKGTLSDGLVDEYGYYKLAPGDLYREEARLKTEFGLRAMSYWGDGNLCPDEMTNELVFKTLFNDTPSKVIFDGYPRSLPQAVYLDTISKIDRVFDMVVEEEMVIKRLLNRGRVDDTEEVIGTRLKVYYDNNKDLIDYYKDDSRYCAISSSGTPKNTLSLAKLSLGLA